MELTYDEALEKVNNFMQKSGIRDFCRNECRGACCRTFVDNKLCGVKDSSTCNPPLTCAIALCRELSDLLHSYGLLADYDKFNGILSEHISRASCSTNREGYFSKATDDFCKGISYPKEPFDLLEKEDAKKIRTHMRTLTRLTNVITRRDETSTKII